MKTKVLLLIISFLFLINPVLASTDRFSEDYLKNRKHFAIINPFVEGFVQRAIKKAILKEAKGTYKVKFDAYTTESLKKGIFKHLEITGKNVIAEGVEIPYFRLYTDTDYNWIDYTQSPVVFNSDITFSTEVQLDEKGINQALQTTNYKKKLQKVNKRAYPLFAVNDVRIRIRHDKVHIIVEYNFPIAPANKNKTFMVSSNFNIDNGHIKAYNIGIDNAYGNLPVDKLTNLINLINPLAFTVDMIDSKKCDGRVEKITIDDNIVKINGKMYIKGDLK